MQMIRTLLVVAMLLPSAASAAGPTRPLAHYTHQRWWMLLEKLTPTERAAYILREAFDYAYRDIAQVLRLGEANARQVVTRARQHVVTDRRMPVTSSAEARLLDAFEAAARNGDVAGLETLLASHVSSSSACSVAA